MLEYHKYPQAVPGLVPISYITALLSPFLHAIVYIFTKFSECTCTDCEKNRITKKYFG
jgi:hypothetical protein